MGKKRKGSRSTINWDDSTLDVLWTLPRGLQIRALGPQAKTRCTVRQYLKIPKALSIDIFDKCSQLEYAGENGSKSTCKSHSISPFTAGDSFKMPLSPIYCSQQQFVPTFKEFTYCQEGENADVLDGIGSQEGARFSHIISDDVGANAWLGELNQISVAGKGADGSHFKLSERLQLAVDDDAASAVMEARFAIDTALTAADTAKEQAQVAEATLLEHIGLLHELSCTEKKVLSVEESLLSAVHQLEVANTAIEHLQIELEATKALTKAGKARIIELNHQCMRQAKELGIETLSSKSTVEQITGGGHMEMLLEKDSRRRDLLSNGPRREIPEWMKRSFDVGQHGLQPRESLPSSADVKAMLPLELPSPEDVWSIAHAKKMQDEMMDLVDYSSKIQETLGCSYNVPDDLDEEELMGELESLEADMGLETGTDVPRYLLPDKEPECDSEIQLPAAPSGPAATQANPPVC
ncbi:unnamed protein product [Sphagnum troendelagicum]|uniref:Uncharacterized protein n=1 Tax=Sphagnum troendelagicum TaxID=128251 RepID=A0ABP0UMA3_9BRYO